MSLALLTVHASLACLASRKVDGVQSMVLCTLHSLLPTVQNELAVLAVVSKPSKPSAEHRSTPCERDILGDVLQGSACFGRQYASVVFAHGVDLVAGETSQPRCV